MSRRHRFELAFFQSGHGNYRRAMAKRAHCRKQSRPIGTRVYIDNDAVDAVELPVKEAKGLPAVLTQSNAMTGSRCNFQNGRGTVRICIHQKHDFVFHFPRFVRKNKPPPPSNRAFLAKSVADLGGRLLLSPGF